MGARGNSGVILSQILRGPRRHVLAARRRSSAADVAAGLRRVGRRRLRRRCSARSRARSSPWCAAPPSRSSGRSTEGETTLVGLLERGRGRGPATAVERTPDLLPVLREAGVVDAGGRGLRAPPRTRACASWTAAPSRGRGGARQRRGRGPRRRRSRGRRRRRPPLRGDVPPRRADDDRIADVQADVGRARRLDRGRRRRRALELPRAHRRHRRRHRGRHRRGPARDIRVTDLLEQVEEREEEAGSASRRRAARRSSTSTTAVVAVAVGDGLRTPVARPRRAAGGRGRAVDEPVDRADPRSGRARAPPKA